VYLTSFWHAIGPFLPPRNAYILLRNTVYFDGHGIGQALTVLLAYAVITAAILVFLDWYRSPELSVCRRGVTRIALLPPRLRRSRPPPSLRRYESTWADCANCPRCSPHADPRN